MTWRFVIIILRLAAIIYALVALLIFLFQRQLLYIPSHRVRLNAAFPPDWKPWLRESKYLGFCREVAHPRAAWLMLHGNAGEASLRSYVLPHIAPSDSFYVLEYPGYGARPGNPGRSSFNRAAYEAYVSLRAEMGKTPLCILGESIGSGPACSLAAAQPAPEKIVLVTPFDRLARVAGEHFPLLPVAWLLRDRWDNLEALKNYVGPLEIYGATEDTIIPIEHAERIASARPTAKFLKLPGGHNDWSSSLTGFLTPP